ncbi:hypothetical protein [Oceanicaulis sp.]|uniref:hypothetical protein n=1 Tax=Oceanicaulis sp. TaxID=1924941 RepID=UPI003F71F08A
MRFDGGAEVAEGLNPGAFELHDALYQARLAQGLGWSWNVGTASPVLCAPDA